MVEGGLSQLPQLQIFGTSWYVFLYWIFVTIVIHGWHVSCKMATLKSNNGAEILFEWHEINHIWDYMDPHWQVGIWTIF